MLVDTHCHMNFPPLFQDPAAVLQRARACGVEQVIVPAYNHQSFDELLSLAELPGVFPAFGLHPWVVTSEPLDIARLDALLSHPKCVAVGEIGLDTKITPLDIDLQLRVLRSQLDLAAKHDLPVLLHCRGAFEELATLLAQYSPRLRGVLHAFSRGPELARRFTDLGLHLAFGGAITRPRAKQARQAAKTLDPSRLLLETDAPSIGLEGVEPKDVEPAHVATIAKELASLRNEPTSWIEETTTSNAQRLFTLT